MLGCVDKNWRHSFAQEAWQRRDIATMPPYAALEPPQQFIAD
jgi:hypothetical protein